MNRSKQSKTHPRFQCWTGGSSWKVHKISLSSPSWIPHLRSEIRITCSLLDGHTYHVILLLGMYHLGRFTRSLNLFIVYPVTTRKQNTISSKESLSDTVLDCCNLLISRICRLVGTYAYICRAVVKTWFSWMECGHHTTIRVSSQWVNINLYSKGMTILGGTWCQTSTIHQATVNHPQVFHGRYKPSMAGSVLLCITLLTLIIIINQYSSHQWSSLTILNIQYPWMSRNKIVLLIYIYI